MKNMIVQDLLVPIAGYATVSQDATLADAVKSLVKAQKEYDQSRDRHRAILVHDENNKIVGKLSQLDVIRALEPKYLKFKDRKELTKFGFTKNYMDSMLKEMHLWNEPLDNICEKATEIIVKTVMYTPTEGEYVRADASLEEAIHQLIMGRHQSLLVTDGKNIVGVLRLTDVFRELAGRICECSGSK